MYNFSILLDQTSTIAPTETVSPTLVSGPSSDSVSDGTAMNDASKLSVLKIHIKILYVPAVLKYAC